MNPVLKLVLYVVLIVGAVFCGQRFFAQYALRMEQASRRFDTSEGTNAAPDGSLRTPANANTSDAAVKPSGSWLGVYGAACFGCVVVFGLFLAHDVSQYLAHRTHKALYNEEAEGIADPEYDAAEQVWADGDHLEAIRLMREYLAKNPREVHVSLRIAEIYEKDLGNPLAAALEYEDILKVRLDPERWGWAAIHLCNLYYRLDKVEPAEALLNRIVKEYGATSAAKKARERLGLPELQEETAQAEEETPAPEETPGGLKLPPGFRPKKG